MADEESLACEDSLLGDDGRRHACSGVFDEVPHAPSFGALHGNQAHVTADMIGVAQYCELRFVTVGVTLKPLRFRS